MHTISCLCVTRSRVNYLKRAIQCFRSQSYENKELVIVYEMDDLNTTSFLKTFSDSQIKKISVDVNPKKTLGQLRNIAIDTCSGEYFTQWDDDDFFDSERLARQYHHLIQKGKQACVLRRWCMYDRPGGKVYTSNYMDVVGGGENTLLCQKSLLNDKQVYYPHQVRGEDTAVIQWLILHDHLTALDEPDLYIYEVTGQNTWDRAHFEQIFKHSCFEASPEDTQKVKQLADIESDYHGDPHS